MFKVVFKTKQNKSKPKTYAMHSKDLTSRKYKLYLSISKTDSSFKNWARVLKNLHSKKRLPEQSINIFEVLNYIKNMCHAFKLNVIKMLENTK